MRKSTTGFTIVELLIVIVVIAILAAITIVSYNGITASANDANVKAGLSTVAQKLTADFQLSTTAYCYTDPNDAYSIDMSCVNSSQTLAALPQISVVKNGADVIRYYEVGGSPVLAAASQSGKFFLVKNGALTEITSSIYQSTSPGCGRYASWASSTKTWTMTEISC